MAESTILVNAEWKNESTGNTVTYNGKTYTIGSDAFGSIQTAVNAAQAGAIINVAKGEYAEDVTISKALTLNGASGYASKVTSIGIGADHVTIQGFSIKPAKQNCLGSNEMPLAAGVYSTAGGAENPLQDITVTNNRIDCSGTMEAGVKATGVAFGTGPDSHFSTNVVVSNNRITGGNSDTAQNGIYLRFVDGATVAGNTVSDFSHHLVQFETGGNYTVSNNVLSNTDRNGIQFGGDTPGTNTVTGNSISNCRGSSSDDAALVLRNAGDGSLSVSGNNITDSTTGVYISNVTEVTGLMVSGNVIDSNTTDIVSDNASKVTLSGNNYGSEAATTKGNVDAGTSVDAETGEEKFIINAAFSSQKTVAGLDGKFYTVGTNAFATLPDAIAALSAQTEELEVTGTVNWPGNQTLDLSGTTGKIILTFNGLTGPTLGAYKNYIIGNDSTVVVFDNVDADCHIFLQNLEEVILTGNSSVRITTYNNNDNQSTTTFTEVGKLTVESGSVCDFANANQFGLRGTTIAGGGTIRTSGTLLISGDTSGFTGTLEITNGVQMESVASGFANASQIINNGTMYCNAAGTFTYANTITGDGMIKAWVQNAGTDVVLTGDLSGYTGQFDALSGNTIKLNTKLHDTINLAHSSGAAGMIELNGDGNSKDIIINSTTNTSTALKIFANWNNITVQSNGNETSTVLGTIYFGGNGNAAAAEDLKVALSSINQTDGKSIGNLYFGGIGNTVSDGADADTNAIYVVVDTNYGAIVGGGQQSTINGDITFDVVTGAFGAQIVGAGDGNTIDGNISINVSSADDASVGNIIGGQAVHEVSGNISIAIADGTVGNVYGLNSGDANGTAVGNIQIDVTGGTVSSIRGGNSTSGKVPGTFEAKSVKINLTGGEVTGKIYGGSQLTTNSIAVVVDGGTAADIFAGSKYAAVETASIEVKSGSVGSIYGGGAGGADDEDGAIGISSVESSRITVSGGTVNGEIYGGGTEGDATKSAAINITGGTIKDDIYGGGYGEASVGNASVTIDGTNVTFSGGKISIYGGGNGTGAAPSGSVSKVGTASVSLTNVDQGETMLYVYGGGIYGQQSVTGSTVTIKDSTVWNVYGGLANGTGSVETAEIVMNGSTAQNVYGGSMMASTGAENTSVTLTGGSTVANVYGGGENGGVTGDVAVIVNGASVTGELNLGSASGSAAVSGTATLTVSGGNNTINGVTANGIEGGSTINVQDGSKIAGVSSDGALTITGNGVFTAAIEAESLTAETLTFEVTQAELAKGALVNVTGSGSSLAAIEIKLTDGDLSSFNGAQLLSGNIDSTGLTITLTDETASSVTVEKGDMGALLVNSDWAGITAGALVLYDGAYYEIGTNAFANLTDAVGAAAEEATILVADGTYDESVVVSGNRNLEIGDIQITSLTLGTKDEAFTGSFTLDSLTPVSGSASDKNGRLVLLNGEFASSTNMSAGTIWLGNSDFDTPNAEALKGVSYTISAGTVSVDYGFYVGCANPDADDPNKNSLRRGYYTLTVTGTGSLDAPSANLNIRQDGVFNLIGEEASANLSQYHVYGEANISERATLETSNLLIYNDDHKAEMTVKDSTVTVQSGLNVGYTKFRNGTLNLDNSVLNANVVNLGSYGDAGTSPLYPYPEGYEKAQLNLSNGAELKATGTFEIKDTGVLNLTDSTLTAAGTITNNGVMNLSGSTLTATGTITNKGEINVSGTSTVEATIDGAVNLLDDTDVTFKGGAKDLLVESGAEVTLRGELSGNEVVYEKGYKYNADDAQGITVNIDSGEGTTFQSYAWYASNGSTYNVMADSNVELTYANINATGTVNVAKGATLTTVRESSNIVGTLNVDGTMNGVMTVYAGYTGGEYADGAQAGEVNINGTGTVNTSIMTIGTAVRDDDQYNAAAVEGSNTTASVVVDGGTLNATGFEGELTSKLFVGSDDSEGVLTGKNGAKINVGERSANGTGYMRFIIGEQGTLNLDNSTMTVYNLGGTNNSVNGIFENSGTISMDLASQIITATVLNNNYGTITVDMSDATEFGVYKLVDYTGTGPITDYGSIQLSNNNYFTRIIDNDLYLVRADGARELYVNSAWKGTGAYDEVNFVDGTTAYYGLNAFDTVDNAVKSLSANDPILLNVTGGVEAITVVGTSVTEVNASAKTADIREDSVIDTDAIVVNLVDINNTNAGWQVYYPLASGSNAQVYGNITTNFLSTTFTAWGEKTADPNFIGGAYAGSTATVYGNTTVNLGAADAADDALMLDTSFLIGAGAGTVNGNSSVNINSGTIQANAIVGGGAWRGQVKGDSSVTISGGQITVNSTEDSPGRAIIGGSYGNVSYAPDAPGDPAATAGKSSVTITGDAVVSGKVVGGSDISAVTNSSVTISGQAQVTGNVYGGGNRGGQVKENAAVTIADSAVLTGNVYGGGFGTDTTDSIVQGSTSVTLSGGTVTGNVYAGGSNSSVAGDAAVTLTGGTVGGDVYGSGEGSGTVAGASTLNVGAADAARYTTTLNDVYDFDVANITNAAVTVDGVFAATQINIADSTLTLNSGFDAATTTVSIEVGAYNAENAALVLGSAVGTAPAISISAGSNALTEARYLVATGFDDTTAFSLEESLAEDYLLRAVDGNIYLYNADAPYFTTELSVTQAEGASVDGNYTFTANFEAEGLLLTGYTLKLYDSATATTPIDEITLGADVVGQEFTFANTVQNFWISVTANGENGQSTDSPTSGRLEVAVQDHDSPVILSVTSDAKSDSVTLACEATDNFGVTGYEFILDGQSLGVQSGSQLALDISNLAAGTHSYTVNVYDAAGNLAGSAEQSFEFTPAPGPGPEPTVPASFLYSSQVRVNNGETVTVYANYSNTAAVLEYRIGDTGDWLAYDAAAGVNVSASTTVYFREQGISDPVVTAVDVTVVPADVELNAEVIQLARTADTTYEATYNFADGGSKTVELPGNTFEHYALPEETTVTIVEKDASGTVVNTIVEETPVASTTPVVPDKVVAVDDGHANLFFAISIGKWAGNRAQHQGDGVWGGTGEYVALAGKNRFSTVFEGGEDATTLFLTDDANGDAFFLDDVYTANGGDARISKMSEIQAGAGNDIVDLTSFRFDYVEHASKQLTIRGGDGNDILWGNAGHNIMFGDDGNDKIYGGSDNDVLIGGTGNDTMLGGGGDDIFCYGSSFDWGSDTITQLSGGTVTLYLDGIDRNDCSISGSTLTWNDGTHTGSITLNGVSWDSVKFYCAANGDGDLTKQSDYEELKNKGAFAAISSH